MVKLRIKDTKGKIFEYTYPTRLTGHIKLSFQSGHFHSLKVREVVNRVLDAKGDLKLDVIEISIRAKRLRKDT